MSTASIPLGATLGVGVPLLILATCLAHKSTASSRHVRLELLSTSDPNNDGQTHHPIPSGLPLPPNTPTNTPDPDPRHRNLSLKPLFLRLHPSKQSPLPREFYDIPPRPGKSSGTPSVVEMGRKALGRAKVSLGVGEGGGMGGKGSIARSEAGGKGSRGGRGGANASMPGLSPEPGQNPSDPSDDPSNTSSIKQLIILSASISILAQIVAFALIFGIVYLILAPQYSPFDSRTARVLFGIAASAVPVGSVAIAPVTLGRFVGAGVKSAGNAMVVGRVIGVMMVSAVIAVVSNFTSSYALIGLTGGALLIATCLYFKPLVPRPPSGWFGLNNANGKGGVKLMDEKPRLRGLKVRDKRATKSFFSGDLLGSSVGPHAPPKNADSVGARDARGQADGADRFIIGQAEAGDEDEDDSVAEILAIARSSSREGEEGIRRNGPKTLEELKAGDSWLSSPSRITEGEETGPSFSYDESDVSAVSPITHRIRNTASASHHLHQQHGTPRSHSQREAGEMSNSWLTSDDSTDKGTTMSPWSYATAEEASPGQHRGGATRTKQSFPASESGFADEPSVIRNYDPANMTSASENERFSGMLNILPPLARMARVASDSSFYSAMEYNNETSHSKTHPGDQSFPRSVSGSFSEDDLGLPVGRMSEPAPDDFGVEELRGALDQSDEDEDERDQSRYARSPSPISRPPTMPLPTLPQAGELRRSSSYDGDLRTRATASGDTPVRAQKPSTDSDQTITQYAILSVNSTAQEVPPSATGRHTPYSQSPMSPVGGYAHLSEKFSTDPLLMGTLESAKGPMIRPGSQLDIRWDQMSTEEGGLRRRSAKKSLEWRVGHVLLLMSAWSSWALSVPLMLKVRSPSEIALVLFLVSLAVPVLTMIALMASAGQRGSMKHLSTNTDGRIRLRGDKKEEGLSRIAEMSSRSIRPDSLPIETKWADLIRQIPSLRRFGYRPSREKYPEEQNWEQVDLEQGRRPLSRQEINKRMSRPASQLWIEQGEAFSGGRLSRAINFIRPDPRISVATSNRLSRYADREQESPADALARGYPMEALRAVSPVPSVLYSVVRAGSPLANVPLSSARLLTLSDDNSDNDSRRDTFKTAITDSPETKSVRNARVHTVQRAQRSHSPAFILNGQHAQLPEELLEKVRLLQVQEGIYPPEPAMLSNSNQGELSNPILSRPRSAGDFSERRTDDNRAVTRRRTMEFANRLSGLWSSDQKTDRRVTREGAVEMGFLQGVIVPNLVPTIKVRDSTVTLRAGTQEIIAEEPGPKSPRPSCSTFHESVDLSHFRPSVDFVRPGSISHGQSSSLDFGQASISFGEKAVESTPVRGLRHSANHSRNSSLPQLGELNGPTWLQEMKPVLDEYGRWIDTPIKSFHDGQTPQSRRSQRQQPRSKLSAPPVAVAPSAKQLGAPMVGRSAAITHDVDDGLSLPPFPVDMTQSSTRPLQSGSRSLFPRSSDEDVRASKVNRPVAPTCTVHASDPLSSLKAIQEEPVAEGAFTAMDEPAVERLEKSIENGGGGFEYESGMFDDAPESGDVSEVSFTTEAAEVMEQIMMSSGARKASKASIGPFAVASGKSSFPADAVPNSPSESDTFEDPPLPTSHFDLGAYASMLDSEEWARVPSAKVLLSKKSSDTIGSRRTAPEVASGRNSPSLPSPLHTKGVGSRKGSRPPVGSGLAKVDPHTDIPGGTSQITDLPTSTSHPMLDQEKDIDPQDVLTPTGPSFASASQGMILPDADYSGLPPIQQPLSLPLPAPPPAKVLRPLHLLGENTPNKKMSLGPSLGPAAGSSGKGLKSAIISPEKSSVGETVNRPRPISILKSRSGVHLHDWFINDENIPPVPSETGGNGKGSLSSPHTSASTTVSNQAMINQGRKKMSTGPGGRVALGIISQSTAHVENVPGTKTSSGSTLSLGGGRRKKMSTGPGATPASASGRKFQPGFTSPEKRGARGYKRSRSSSPVKVGGGSLR